MPPDLPRFVPTLTEVVQPPDQPADADAAAARPVPEPARQAADELGVAQHAPEQGVIADDMAEQIAHRVLQRVDAVLADRLSDAIRQIVLQHTQTLIPAVREEIVVAVHAAVAEALADEFLSPDGASPI